MNKETLKVETLSVFNGQLYSTCGDNEEFNRLLDVVKFEEENPGEEK